MAVVQVTITSPPYNTLTPAPGALVVQGFVDPSVGATVVACLRMADGTILDPVGGGLTGANWNFNFNLPNTAAGTAYTLVVRASVPNPLIGQPDTGIDQIKLRS